MRTLLIVDDEILIADGLRDMLAAAFTGQLNVICRHSAATALEAARNLPVSILLTDINMPNTTGLELHRAIREMYPDCRVIYLTGYSDFDYARTALSQQAFAYILKGEGDEVVISTVEKALASFPAEEPEEAGGETVPGSQDPIASLKEYIQAHLNEDLSLNRLSEVCHFHPVYMSRVFKEAEGVTVGDYINRVRLEKAKELLTGSRLTVLEISRQMGFATDNYFCRWFRRQTGFSPHRFRELKI